MPDPAPKLDASADVVEQATEPPLARADRLHDVLEKLEDGILTVTAALEIQDANAAMRRLAHPTTLSCGQPLPEPWEGFSLRAFTEELIDRGVAAPGRVTTPAGEVYSIEGSRLGTGALIVLQEVTASERRDRAEREFVANAAHELRTPIASITASIDVLQSGAKEVPAERDRFLEHIQREAQRLASLARSLLVLARVQTGLEEPRTDLVELAPIVEAARARLAASTSVEVRAACPADLVVLANQDLVEQIVMNLAENAAKNTPEGSIWIEATEVAPGQVVVEVSDTGRGIGEHELERVFDRFYRGATVREGFGLGLAIAREAAEALGGTLEIASKVGGGTVARLTLPSGGLVRR